MALSGTGQGNVCRSNRRLGAALATLAAMLATLGLAAQAQAFVYFDVGGTNGAGAIGRANPDGSGVNPRFVPGASGPNGVAVDGQYIYWANLSADTIGRARLDGSGVTQAFITGANSPTSVAVDGQHVYWTNSPNTAGSIGRANLDGTGVNQSFIGTADNPGGVAVNGQFIYWTNNSSAAIGRANLDGTGVTQTLVTPSLAAPNTYGGIAADAVDQRPHRVQLPVAPMQRGRGRLSGDPRGGWSELSA